MGQIIGGAAKPKRCNLNKLSQLGTPAVGEYILVSSDNSMNAAGQGNFDCYIEGDGKKAATALELKAIASDEVVKGDKNAVTGGAVLKLFQEPDITIDNLSAGYWNTNADTLPFGQNTLANCQSAKFLVNEGEVYKIYGTAGSSNYYRFYALYDFDGNRVERYSSAGNHKTSPVEVTIPQGIETMVVNLTQYDSETDKIVKEGAYYNIPELAQDVETVKNDALYYKMAEKLPSADYVENYYIRYADGVRTTGAASHQFKTYYFPVAGVIKIQATLGMLDAIPAAIAFFSSDIDLSSANAGDYMHDVSVDANPGVHNYEVEVPAGAKWVCITNRYASLSSPSITFYSSPINTNTTDAAALLTAQEGYAVNVFANAPNMYHFAANGFIKDGAGHNAIASQSLEDVELAARLGFKFIEANIHQTSDGDFVCIHGTSAAFGPECKSADESVITTENLRTTLINSVTVDWIKTNVLYDSYYTKYQTTIPTLDEFCRACKINNIGIFAGTSIRAAIEKCVDYLGNNVIVYNPPSDIRDYFKGYVFVWNNSSALTIQNLVKAGKIFGAPYICSIGPATISQFQSDGILADFVSEVHAAGFLCGFASVYQQEADTRSLFAMGFDMNSTGHEVNPFASNYELYDIDAGDLPETTGTLADGILTLETGQTITCGSDDVIAVGRGNLFLKFSGSITVNFGSVGSRSLTSDGQELINVSDYFFMRGTKLLITSTARTELSYFVYKTSKD